MFSSFYLFSTLHWVDFEAAVFQPKILGYWFFCFFIGSIPSGLWLGKIFGGMDVRTQGSGNIGATNVVRLLGKKMGFLTFFLDFGKALLMVGIGACFFLGNFPVAFLVGGVLVVVGHTRSVFLKFTGGKGVASLFGLLLGLDWRIFLLAAITWLVVFGWGRISGLSALFTLLVLPFFFYFFYSFSFAFVLLSLLSFYILLLHHKNIKQLTGLGK